MNIKKELQSLLKWIEENGDKSSLCWARHFQKHGIEVFPKLDINDPVLCYIQEMRPKNGKFYDKNLKDSAWFFEHKSPMRKAWLKSLIKRTPANLER